ncbi:MAG: hypothetical protein Q9195_005526 [Heterodermia aff. obscurata]
MRSILLSELLLSPCPINAATALIAANDTRRCTACYTWFIDLDTPKLTSSLLQDRYLLQSRSRNTCPLCCHEGIASERKILNAHHRQEHDAGTLTATPYPTPSFSPEQCRYLARRDVKLYQALRDRGSKLPALFPAQCKRHDDQGIDSLLDQTQERALFRALQQLGAFCYPGMAENMRDREGRPGWIQDGHRVFFEKPPDLDERETSRAKGSKARRWTKRVMVSGRMLPKRMDRADFKLEPVVEVNEVEAVVDWNSSVGWPLAD